MTVGAPQRCGVKTERGRTTMGTYTPKPGEIERRWHVIDANDVILGRLASQVATLLRGKHKPTFAPHVDGGDFVVIINAEKIALSGNKRAEFRYRHSGYPGGLSRRTVGELLETKPERVIELAVRGMLPKTTLGRSQLRKLKIYAGPEHPHAAQKPQPFEIKQVSQ
jgi:large subunit ribosomal protein L13